MSLFESGVANLITNLMEAQDLDGAPLGIRERVWSTIFEDLSGTTIGIHALIHYSQPQP